MVMVEMIGPIMLFIRDEVIVTYTGLWKGV